MKNLWQKLKSKLFKVQQLNPEIFQTSWIDNEVRNRLATKQAEERNFAYYVELGEAKEQP